MKARATHSRCKHLKNHLSVSSALLPQSLFSGYGFVDKHNEVLSYGTTIEAPSCAVCLTHVPTPTLYPVAYARRSFKQRRKHYPSDGSGVARIPMQKTVKTKSTGRHKTLHRSTRQAIGRGVFSCENIRGVVLTPPLHPRPCTRHGKEHQQKNNKAYETEKYVVENFEPPIANKRPALPVVAAQSSPR